MNCRLGVAIAFGNGEEVDDRQGEFGSRGELIFSANIQAELLSYPSSAYIMATILRDFLSKKIIPVSVWENYHFNGKGLLKSFRVHGIEGIWFAILLQPFKISSFFEQN